MAKVVSRKVMDKWLWRYNLDFPAAQLLISSHGMKNNSVFVVPKKTRIWFFCPDSHSLSDSGIINFINVNTQPYEVYEEGTICPDYLLQYYERDRLIDESIIRFKEWMEDKALTREIRADSKASGVVLDAQTEATLNRMDKGVETRPVAIVTVEPAPAVPWYSFASPKITTLQDIVRWNDSLGMFDGYGDILCSFCRAVDGSSVTYNAIKMNKFENIWYVSKNGKEQRNK
ncbi:putative adhesin [Pelagibaculum spongiae]|uniref:Putative adhesin Stv domain-containing protein n=1 Tax=Pelagibaculum spongiae TaxID=2080658 RepID=A0A2V1H1E7_9GAMM|nr:hypothetical protein [Pelagibaculum spongiae]PVZ72509.1 hypothetical protein DC094_05770 [Pelagibaculum spongiae]